jgi:ABC-type Fe3+ transport system permease subunit
MGFAIATVTGKALFATGENGPRVAHYLNYLGRREELFQSTQLVFVAGTFFHPPHAITPINAQYQRIRPQHFREQ